MEEYFARQRRRRLLGAACSLVVFAAVFVVALFAMFRTHSNYQFRSIADFFYQTLLAPAQLDYECRALKLMERTIIQERRRPSIASISGFRTAKCRRNIR